LQGARVAARHPGDGDRVAEAPPEEGDAQVERVAIELRQRVVEEPDLIPPRRRRHLHLRARGELQVLPLPPRDLLVAHRWYRGDGQTDRRTDGERPGMPRRWGSCIVERAGRSEEHTS